LNTISPSRASSPEFNGRLRYFPDQLPDPDRADQHSAYALQSGSPSSICIRRIGRAGDPETVREWRANLPSWIEVPSAQPTPDIVSNYLHAGERDAISLALNIQADALIIDERRGREEAEKLGLKVIGTLGVIVAAHESGLLDLTETFDRLRQTTFHVSPKLLAAILRKYEVPAEDGG